MKNREDTDFGEAQNSSNKPKSDPEVWKLDKTLDGGFDIFLGDLSNVLEDIMKQYQIVILPSHWILTKL